MPRLQALGGFFNIEPGELGLVRLLFCQSFFRGTTKAFVRICAYTLFLSQFEITWLPLVYVGSAFAGTPITLFYLKLERKLSLSGLLSTNLCATSVALFCFAFALLITEAAWIAFTLPILCEVIIGLINTETATLNSHVLTVRQGKRLLGLIGSGEFLAQIGVGFSIVVLVELVGISNLLLLAALSSVASLAVFTHIFVGSTHGQSGAVKIGGDTETTKEDISFMAIAKKRYVSLLFVSYFLFIMAYYIVDSAFYFEVSARFSSDQDIAVFLGQFTALYGLLALFGLAFVSGRVLGHYGLLVGLMILPAGMGAGIMAVILTGAIGGPETLIFWLVVATQLNRFVLNNVFNRPSRNILSHALPVGQRSRTLATQFGIVDPVSTGLAGGCLWVSMNLLGFGTVELFYLVSIVLMLWAYLLVLTYREYLVSLVNALSRYRRAGKSLDLDDASTLPVVRHGLSSVYPAEVIYCLNVLEQLHYEEFETNLVGLLQHPEPEVRREVLRKIRKLDSASIVARVRDSIANEAAPEVLGEAIKTLVCVDDAESIGEISPYLEHPESPVRLGAMVGLLGSGGIEGALVAGESFLRLSRSNDPRERTFAAQVCGQVARENLRKPLLTLLQDDDPVVRKAALRASGVFKSEKIIRSVAAQLGTSSLCVEASSALVAMGQSSLPALELLFVDETQSRDTRARVAYVLGRIGGPSAVASLVSEIGQADKALRLPIFNALRAGSYRAEGNETGTIVELLKKESREAAWICTAAVELACGDSTDLLDRALELELLRARERILLLLSFLYSPQAVLRCKIYLSNPSLEKRALALEVIDNFVSSRTRDMIFPLLENLPIKERRNRLVAQFPIDQPVENGWLEQIAGDTDNRLLPWTRCCALHSMGCSTRRAYEPVAVAALNSSTPAVRETALWTLGQLKSGDRVAQLETLLDDDSPRVAAMARAVLGRD